MGRHLSLAPRKITPFQPGKVGIVLEVYGPREVGMLHVAKRISGLFVVGLGLVLVGASTPAVERTTASMAFPLHKSTSDVDDIIEEYSDYLTFILSIARSENASMARQIEERFSRLKRADEKQAARFLKGLRFEMIQKLELTGLSARRVSTDTPAIRKWVAKYMAAWLREVDEYQFRAYTASLIARRSE